MPTNAELAMAIASALPDLQFVARYEGSEMVILDVDEKPVKLTAAQKAAIEAKLNAPTPPPPTPEERVLDALLVSGAINQAQVERAKNHLGPRRAAKIPKRLKTPIFDEMRGKSFVTGDSVTPEVTAPKKRATHGPKNTPSRPKSAEAAQGKRGRGRRTGHDAGNQRSSEKRTSDRVGKMAPPKTGSGRKAGRVPSKGNRRR